MASPIQLKNNAVGRLTSGVSSLETTLPLVSGDGAKFPTLTGAQYFPATLTRASDSAVEIVKVTARSGDVLTVVRAQEGTTGLALLAGDRVEIRLTAGTLTDEIARIETTAEGAVADAAAAAAAAAAAQSTANSALSLASAAAPDTSVVKLTGAQTVAGVKTFSSSPVIPDGAAAQNPVSKAQLDAEAVARAAAISAAVDPATLVPTLSDDMGADVPTTSGTSHAVAGIPSWALRIEIDLLGVSVSGTDNFGFQVGNSGGFVTSGYAGGVSGGTYEVAFSNAFTTMQSNAPAGVWQGQITLRRARATDTTWSYAAIANRSDGPSVTHLGAGSVTISDLDRVRIAMLSGVSTFDAGVFRVRAGI